MTYSPGAAPGTGKIPKPATNRFGAPSDAPRIPSDHRARHVAATEKIASRAKKEIVRSKNFAVSALMPDGEVRKFTYTAASPEFLENICARFGRGTLIDTDSGPTAVEDLQPGTQVRTKDNGWQTLKWIGSCSCDGSDFKDEDRLPLRIKADALGQLRPEHDLLVTPGFRVLLNHPNCAALFDTAETLASAIDLIDSSSILRLRPRGTLWFYNLMFDAHQIIKVNGLESESFHPGNFGVNVLGSDELFQMRQIFPHLRGDLGGFGRTARPILRNFESEILKVG